MQAKVVMNDHDNRTSLPRSNFLVKAGIHPRPRMKRETREGPQRVGDGTSRSEERGWKGLREVQGSDTNCRQSTGCCTAGRLCCRRRVFESARLRRPLTVPGYRSEE